MPKNAQISTENETDLSIYLLAMILSLPPDFYISCYITIIQLECLLHTCNVLSNYHVPLSGLLTEMELLKKNGDKRGGN